MGCAFCASGIGGLVRDLTCGEMIDQMLADEGWNVGKGMASTEEVKKEYPVSHQPTESGEGFADYVLFDDNGKPLAVIEAKRTSEDPQKGRTQAKLYADGIAEQDGQRPVIFYTNGYEHWLWDDAAGYPPREVQGFYTGDELELTIQRRATRQKLPRSQNLIPPEKYPPLSQTSLHGKRNNRFN